MAAPLRGSLQCVLAIGRSISSGLNTELRCSYHLRIAQIKPQQTTPLVSSVRGIGSFFQTITSEELWKSVTSVSNAGRRRGRGKRVGRKRVVDLNKGQVLGTGKDNMIWPGLNTPVIKGRQVIHRQQLPPNQDFKQQLAEIRDKSTKMTYEQKPPLLRGWTGRAMAGISLGAPDPVGDYEFEGFDTRVLEFKMVANMTGNLGRKQKYSAFVVTGNGKGLAGYALGKSPMGKVALRKAKNSAAQHLRYIELYDNHTVYHNFHSKFHKTQLFVHKREKGYGLKCHRALKTICEVIGIKDLHVRTEGNTKNMMSVTKAFFDGLEKQETHQDLADRMGYHVVEMRKERDNLPVVVASPTNGPVQTKDLVDEHQDLNVDFNRLYMGGRVEYVRPKKKPVYHKLKSWRYAKAQVHKRRGQEHAQILRLSGLW